MKKNLRVKSSSQNGRNESAWSIGEAVAVRAWEFCWYAFLRWTPKKLNVLRLFALRLFGARVFGRPFVFPSARIYAPFNLEIYDGACIGPFTNIYNLGHLVLHKRCIVSQESMLCGGSHDLNSCRLPLLVGDIEIGDDVFVGARAFILPGVTIGTGAVVGAGAVVAKDVQDWEIVAGNPARVIGRRTLGKE